MATGKGTILTLSVTLATGRQDEWILSCQQDSEILMMTLHLIGYRTGIFRWRGRSINLHSKGIKDMRARWFRTPSRNSYKSADNRNQTAWIGIGRQLIGYVIHGKFRLVLQQRRILKSDIRSSCPLLFQQLMAFRSPFWSGTQQRKGHSIVR